MNRMVKNLMVVLIAALMFFTSVMTPVHAESASEEPVETPTEEVEETPAEQPAETPTEEVKETPAEQPAETPAEEVKETPAEQPAGENAEPQTPGNDEGEPTEAVKPEEAGQESTSEPATDGAAKKDDTGEELEKVDAEEEPADEPVTEETAVEAEAAPAVKEAPALMKAKPARASSNKVPEHSKTLTDNGDGTYTLTLSVTGSGETDVTTPKANVIFIMDRSGSMQYTDGGSGYYLDNRNGSNGYVNGQYVRLTYYSGNYYYNNGSEYIRYDGPRFSYTSYNRRRDQVAIAAATNLVDSLLSHNTTASSDTVEIAFVSFNDMASDGNDGNWTTSKSVAERTVAGYTYVDDTGTNWEDALIHAGALASAKAKAEPDEPMYIIFLTDGNPTRYVDDNGNMAGGGTSSWISKSYEEAEPRALELTNAGYNLYNIGVFGSTDRMEGLTDYANGATAEGHGTATYYPASNSSALQQAFNEILASITNSLSLADVKMTDGVTGMTSSAGVNGKPGNFKYTMIANGETTTWTDAPDATVDENNVVTWDLSEDKNGKELIIADGVTVTCSFVVWPSQKAQDLVADLNNGVKKYDTDLNDNEKAQIRGSGTAADPYTLKTNTDFPTLDYSIAKTVQKEGQDPEIVTEPQPQVQIKNPEPIGLAGTTLNAKKEWEDSLDIDQREEISDVVLYIKVDNDYYYKNKETGEKLGVTLNAESDWTETDYIHVSPGLMVTQDSPAYDPTKPHVTWDGKTYAVLESGHDYIFEEESINGHYELTAYTHHPMIMGYENGKPVIMDVIFTKDASGNITGIESAKAIGDTISATNTLKGGVDIEKKVVKDDGTDFDTNDKFKMTVSLTDAEGNALPEKTAGDGTKYTIDYRIYYGEKNPAYSTSGEKHRSEHIYVSGTSFEQEIYVGDVIRVVNVENGALFNVTENLGQDSVYELKNIAYQIKYGQELAADYAATDKVVKGGKDWYPVKGNSSSSAVVTNKLVPSFFIYHSGVAGDGNLEIIPMSKVNSDGTYNLYAHTTRGLLYGGYYLDYAGKGKYKDDGVKSTGGVAYTGMNYDWDQAKAQTTNGKAMKPVANETYYIKEVPVYYLRNYHQINYMKAKPNKLTALYLISAVDDLNYSATGLILKGNDKSQPVKVVKTMTFTNSATKKSTTLRANTVFKRIGIDGQGSEKDYLTYFNATGTDYFKTGSYTVLPYWVTLDGIEVTGVSTRTITINSLTKSGISKVDSE